MPLKDRLKNKVNRFLHSLAPGRSRSPLPSTNRPITAAIDHQASSTPVGFDSASIHGIPDAQPLNSNIFPSIVISPAGDEAPGRMADLVTLRLVDRVASAFPPLKLAVAGLLGVIDILEVCDFQLSVVIVMVLTVPRQPVRTNKIVKIWSRS